MNVFKVEITEFALNDLQLGRAFYENQSKEQRFPYSIYYDFPLDNVVRVVAVFDQRKNPIVSYEELMGRD